MLCCSGNITLSCDFYFKVIIKKRVGENFKYHLSWTAIRSIHSEKFLLVQNLNIHEIWNIITGLCSCHLPVLAMQEESQERTSEPHMEWTNKLYGRHVGTDGSRERMWLVAFLNGLLYDDISSSAAQHQMVGWLINYQLHGSSHALIEELLQN
jgi:hypothetical protein